MGFGCLVYIISCVAYGFCNISLRLSVIAISLSVSVSVAAATAELFAESGPAQVLLHNVGDSDKAPPRPYLDRLHRGGRGGERGSVVAVEEAQGAGGDNSSPRLTPARTPPLRCCRSAVHSALTAHGVHSVPLRPHSTVHSAVAAALPSTLGRSALCRPPSSRARVPRLPFVSTQHRSPIAAPCPDLARSTPPITRNLLRRSPAPTRDRPAPRTPPFQLWLGYLEKEF